LADGKTWTDRLETYLKNDYRNIWINNAGLDGHSTFGHTVLIEDFIIQLKPDIALLLIGANEGIEDFGKYDKEVMKDKIMFHSLKGFVKSMANHSEVISIVVNLYRYVQATLIGINHREINFSALTKSIHRKSTKAEEKAWEENIHKSTMHLLKGFKNRLENLIDILKKNNITPILITQPTLYGDFTYDIDGSRYSHGKDLHYTLELYNDVTRSVCKDNDLLVIDLAAELPKNTRYYYDFYHYTNEGAKKVADIIYMKLYPYLVQHRW
jgi:hypothetical protein